MNMLDRFLQHDAWQTRKLIEHAQSLDDRQLDRMFEIGPGSVRETLVHIVTCVERWVVRIDDRERYPDRADEDHVWTMDELLELLDEAASDLEMVAGAVEREGRLDESMQFVDEERTYTFTRGTAIAHVITHGMHHRAQVMNMLRHLGAPYPLDGDAIEWEISLQ